MDGSKNTPKGNTYRIYNKAGHYQQVIGNYPRQRVLQDFTSFQAALGYCFPRGHLEDGAFNFLQFVIGTIKAEGIVPQELLLECSNSAKSDVYRNRAVRMLTNHTESGRGWQTYLSDKGE